MLELSKLPNKKVGDYTSEYYFLYWNERIVFLRNRFSTCISLVFYFMVVLLSFIAVNKFAFNNLTFRLFTALSATPTQTGKRYRKRDIAFFLGRHI